MQPPPHLSEHYENKNLSMEEAAREAGVAFFSSELKKKQKPKMAQI